MIFSAKEVSPVVQSSDYRQPYADYCKLANSCINTVVSIPPWIAANEPAAVVLLFDSETRDCYVPALAELWQLQ